MNNVVIRKAERQDVPLLMEFIKGRLRSLLLQLLNVHRTFRAVLGRSVRMAR